MSLFEYSVIGVNFFCDDNNVKQEIINKSFVNMNVYNLIDIEAEVENKNNTTALNKKNDLNNIFNEDELYYFDEDKMESILGEKFKLELSEWDIYNNENICFITSKEEFIMLKDFNGYLICLEEAYVKGIRDQQIIVRNREEALNIIYSMYFTFSSYHILPCDITMAFTEGFNIRVDEIFIKNIDNYKIIYWLYRNIDSEDKEITGFLITNDRAIREKNILDIYGKINELLNDYELKLYSSDKKEDYNLLSLYTLELEKITEK